METVPLDVTAKERVLDDPVDWLNRFVGRVPEAEKLWLAPCLLMGMRYPVGLVDQLL